MVRVSKIKSAEIYEPLKSVLSTNMLNPVSQNRTRIPDHKGLFENSYISNFMKKPPITKLR